MGVVYKAREVRAGRDVAIKMVLSAEYAHAEELARFQTEARAVAAIQHPGVVPLYLVGEHDGRPFLCMEFCPGGSLEARLKQWKPSPSEAAELVGRLADAVQAAHDRRVVHRDLKPANILLTAVGFPKVSDFGLAKRLDAAAGLTQSNAILGTPSYMSPEQAGGRPHLVGPASDVYSLGAILYELLTGQPPFRGATLTDTLIRVLHDEPSPPRRLRPGLPRDLESVCLKCLAKLPVDRYASAADLAADLRRFLDGKPVVARPLGRVKRGLRWARRNPVLLSAAVVTCLALGVAGAMVVAGYRGGPRGASLPEDSDEPNKVSNKEYGVSLTVPGPWRRAAAEDFTVPGTILWAWDGPGNSCLLVFVRDSAEPIDPKVLLDPVVSAKKESLGVEVLAHEVRTVAGVLASCVAYKGKGTGGAIDGKGEKDTVDYWVAVPRDKDVIAVLLTCPAADYSEAKKSFEQAVGSLKLSRRQPQEQRWK